MDLAASLSEMEAQTKGVGYFPPLEPSRQEYLKASIKATGGLPGLLDGRRKLLKVTDPEVSEVIIPLCRWLRALAEALHNGTTGTRVLVGIIGPAGAGKSTLAQLLYAASAILWEADGPRWIECVSMDGYLLPNSHLVTHSAADPEGHPRTLKELKGATFSMDADALLRDLRRLRSSATEKILLPSYDRDIHDPVPDTVVVSPECRLVIMEGLHLLHNEGSWDGVPATFHRTVFVDVERSCCFERVVGRKVANGRSRESSEGHFDRVDGPVFDQLQKEKRRADVILKLRPTEQRALNVTSVEIPRELKESQKPPNVL